MAKTKKTKKAAEKRTYIAIVIDRSGSMDSVRSQAWQGLNEQIRTIKANAEKGGKTFVTMLQFDTEFDVLRNNIPAIEVSELGFEEYLPRGGTALYDAVGRTIGLLEGHGETADTGYLVIVVSDGEENSSREWTSADLKKKIQGLEESGKWTFTYMLANTDMYAVQKNLGISVNNAMSYASTKVGTAGAFTTSNASLGTYMVGRSRGLTSTPDFYKAVATAGGTAASTTIVNPNNTTLNVNVNPVVTLSEKDKNDLNAAISKITDAMKS